MEAIGDKLTEYGLQEMILPTKIVLEKENQNIVLEQENQMGILIDDQENEENGNAKEKQVCGINGEQIAENQLIEEFKSTGGEETISLVQLGKVLETLDKNLTEEDFQEMILPSTVLLEKQHL